MNHKILVPIDFTEVSENALKYAIGAAKTLGTGISLLHIVAKEEDKPRADDQLNALIYRYESTGVGFKSYTKVGSVFEGIGEAAKMLDCGVIFMGTHGVQGLQFLFGSHALKIVTHSEIPFVITQDRAPKDENIDHIVMPVDLGAEEKQILTVVKKVAKTFSSHVHLFVFTQTDGFHENAVNRNLAFAKRYLDEHNIAHTTTRANTIEDYDKQLIAFAESKEADIIAIINHREDGIKNIFGTNFDQNIITNKAKIPVLIVNSKTASSIDDIFNVFI